MRMTTGLLFTAHGYPQTLRGKGQTGSSLAQQYLGEGFVRAMERGGPGNFARGSSGWVCPRRA